MNILLLLMWIFCFGCMGIGLYFGSDTRDHEIAEKGLCIFFCSIIMFVVLSAITAIYWS